MAPLSGAGEHHLPMWAAWHGRGMVLAWGILIPLGVLIARYFKITPRQVWPEELDNKFWWRWHRRLQYVGTFIAVCALVIVIQYARQATAIAHIHGLLGWATMLLAATQIASGVLRGTKGGPTGELAAEGSYRGDHYDMASPIRAKHTTAGTSLTGCQRGFSDRIDHRDDAATYANFGPPFRSTGRNSTLWNVSTRRALSCLTVSRRK